MKAFWYTFILLASIDFARASPPIRSGFMIGPDSETVVYWVHPDVNCYEQEFDTGGAELDLIVDAEPGRFAVATRISFPLLSWIQNLRMKVNQGDLYPGLPGNQYSQFTYGVYPDSDNTCPSREPLMQEENALCGGNPCMYEWAENDISLPVPAGDDLWLAFHWADSTPSAPQLKCRTEIPDGVSVVYGIHNGETYQWHGLNYLPVQQLRILAMTPLDSVRLAGWHSVTAVPPPEGFEIRTFAGGELADSIRLPRIDTLMYRLPKQATDSVHVYSIYGGIRDDEYASVVFHEEELPQLRTEIIPIGYGPGFTDMELWVTNTADDPIEVNAGFSAEVVSVDTGTINLQAHQSGALTFRVSLTESDTGQVTIVLQDRQYRFYPRLVTVRFPDSGHTAVDDSPGAEIYPHLDFRLYPNPSTGGVHISTAGTQRTVVADVYNILGQRVGSMPVAPDSPAFWDGRGVPSGIYLVRMRTASGSITRRILILRQ